MIGDPLPPRITEPERRRELLDSGDRVVSRARGEVQVKSAGAEAVIVQ